MKVAALITIAALALAQQESPPLATSVRGIASTVEFSVAGEPLRAKPATSLKASMLVRILESRPEQDGTTRYRVAFIGTITGDYDLSTLLERQDGSVLAGHPLMVHVVSQLPPNHGTDLFSESRKIELLANNYRAMMIAAGAVWMTIPVAYLCVRLARRKPPTAEVPPPPAATLADQLRPLVEAAIAGTLPVQGRGRLELLLYMHWRQRLGLEGSQANAVALLRRHPDAGRLLRAVEGWLHARRDGSAQPESDVAALLEPYRGAMPIPEDEASCVVEVSP